MHYKDNIVQNIAFDVSAFVGGCGIIRALFTFLTLLFLLLFLHVLLGDKIRHELCKQALQSLPPSKSIEDTRKVPGANAQVCVLLHLLVYLSVCISQRITRHNL